jgi:superfamily II RNA helicase
MATNVQTQNFGEAEREGVVGGDDGQVFQPTQMNTLIEPITLEDCNETTTRILTDNYDFSPDSFQLHACNKIESDENVLVTAHTGSGKTLIAEYTILSKTAKGKKVIYTSPIKSLSNQKFYEFSKKYSDISFGIITGDIKFAPQSQVLVMTTEILRNLLYKKPVMLGDNEELEINMEDVGAVIFDEVHYINDKDRGKVWEESMIMMPEHITMVMLSATIRSPENLGYWLNYIKRPALNLIPNEKRVVPLTHMVYHSVLPHFRKKREYGPLKYLDNNLVEIMDEKNEVNVQQIDKIVNIKSKSRNVFETIGLMNQLLRYMKDNDLLPSLTFVFSRKKCEKMAKFASVHLLSKPEIALLKKKIRFYLKKLDHYDLVISSHQFRMLNRCLERGVAFHHGGMIPALKELVELLYDDGLIKALFATETFAVGINMPTRSVVFSSLVKYDSSTGFRMLKSHEYIQMAGRAGRRGKDTRGYVIHLPTLYHNLDALAWRETLKPTPQMIESKFDYHYSLILQAYIDNTINLQSISSMSLATQEIQMKLNSLQQQWDGQDYSKYNIIFEVEKLKNKFVDKGGVLVYKDRKRQDKDKKKIRALVAEVDDYAELYQEYERNKGRIMEQMRLSKEYQQYSMMMYNNCSSKIQFLQQIKYLDENYGVTDAGNLAVCFNEINPIVGTTIVNYNMWSDMNKELLVKFLGSIGEAKYEIEGLRRDVDIRPLQAKIEHFSMMEQRLGVTPVSDWNTNNILGYLMWEIISGTNTISGVSFEYGIEEGNLLKHLWKFENVCNEFVQAARKAGHNEIMISLQEIAQTIQNMYAPSDSIYIKLSTNVKNDNEDFVEPVANDTFNTTETTATMAIPHSQ